MSAFVDIDSKGNVSIMEMPVEEADILVQALQYYFDSKELQTKSPEEREIKKLKNDLEGILYPL